MKENVSNYRHLWETTNIHTIVLLEMWLESNYKKTYYWAWRYPCTQCEYLATSKGHLAEHKMSVHVIVTTVRIINAQDVNMGIVLIIKSVYMKENLSTCDETSLQRMWVESNYKKTYYWAWRCPCTECEYLATAKGHLTKHKRSVHQGILVVYVSICETCDYK